MYHINEPFKNLPHLTLDGDLSTKKVLLLTHTDMDGSGAAIVLKAALPEDVTVDVQHCSNSTMSKDILKAVTTYDVAKKYDLIIACDISCLLIDAERINTSNFKNKFVLLDHHDTAKFLNKFDWACVHPSIICDEYRNNAYGDKVSLGHSSGTSLMYDYLRYYDFIGDEITVNPNCNAKTLRYLTHMITLFDTWDFREVFGEADITPYELNQAFTGMGSDIFEKKIYERCMRAENGNTPKENIFDDLVKTILRIEQNKVQAHTDTVRKRLVNEHIVLDNITYSMVYGYTDKYLTEVFDMMLEDYPDSDLYAINYGTGVSVRSRKPDIHVGNLLKNIGGGGHAGAGGVKIQSSEQRKYIEAALHGTIQ